jgi:hypothetical protein
MKKLIMKMNFDEDKKKFLDTYVKDLEEQIQTIKRI